MYSSLKNYQNKIANGKGPLGTELILPKGADLITLEYMRKLLVLSPHEQLEVLKTLKIDQMIKETFQIIPFKMKDLTNNYDNNNNNSDNGNNNNNYLKN